LEPDVSAPKTFVALAGVVAAVAAAQPAQAQTHHAHATPRMATLAGSAQRSLAGANVVGHTSPAAPVRVSVFLKPSHQRLLAQMAAQSSAKQGMSASMMRLLFSPSATARAQLAAYMRSQGFAPNGQGVLVSSFTGTAAQAEHAFGVSLAEYQGANGKTFRAPTSAIHLPASIAGDVLSVDGLSTQPLMHPLGLHRKRTHFRQQPRALTGCVGSNGVDTASTFQPQELSAAGAYNNQTLLDNSNDGHGQAIALVEFSNYAQSDLDTFQTCFGTSVPNTRVKVGGGTTNQDVRIEVALDQEVIVGQATGLDNLFTYVAKPSASQAAVLDAMLHNRTLQHLNIVSDSWGLCDLFEPLDQQAATNQELQLLAVAGMSFFVASGDDGSSDCHRLGFNGLDVDDPAGQPYATGVGGTTLTTGPFHEDVWGGHGFANGGGGGGVSTVFRKPSWQVGPGVIRAGQSSKTVCGGKTVYCREVPDISFNADPNTGYVINDEFGWDIVGGTSAAAPLMAAFTADADTFSLANSGMRMGFADPFLYHEAKVDPTMFHDVTTGSNITSAALTKYHAGARYDLASGWGSIDVNQMATDLAAHTRGAVKVHLTKITAGASRNPVTAGHPSKLSGKLVDRTTHKVLAGRVVWWAGVSGNNQVLLRLHTGPKGSWAVTIKRGQLNHRLIWQVLYVGEQGHRPAESLARVLRIG
jgi:kumamolisin